MCSVSRALPAGVRVSSIVTMLLLWSPPRPRPPARIDVSPGVGGVWLTRSLDIAEAKDAGAAFGRRSPGRHGREERHALAHLAGECSSLLLRERIERLGIVAAEHTAELADLRQRGGRHQRLIVEGAAAIGVHFDDGRGLQAAGQEDAGKNGGEESDSHQDTMSHLTVPLNRVSSRGSAALSVVG